MIELLVSSATKTESPIIARKDNDKRHRLLKNGKVVNVRCISLPFRVLRRSSVLFIRAVPNPKGQLKHSPYVTRSQWDSDMDMTFCEK